MAMRILVTGGNGGLGRELVPALITRGHDVVVLDRELGALKAHCGPGLTLAAGVVEDRAALESAIGGAEVVIHLAWSFAEDPGTLLERDLRGHQQLLEAARAHDVLHFIYTSSAVVYGKPVRIPIEEDHPLHVLQARKPSYGLAKEFAEKLTALAAQSGGPPATIFRFWWAFGEEIGGRHLREMLRAAATQPSLAVPAECGGSFLTMEDFVQAIGLALLRPESFGQVFNLASAYVSWEEVAHMVTAVTGSSARVEVVPPQAWTGAAFLADCWQLSDHRIRERLGFAPCRDPEQVRELLRRSIAQTWQRRAASSA